jgi:hypothetical protein
MRALPYLSELNQGLVARVLLLPTIAFPVVVVLLFLERLTGYTSLILDEPDDTQKDNTVRNESEKEEQKPQPHPLQRLPEELRTSLDPTFETELGGSTRVDQETHKDNTNAKEFKENVQEGINEHKKSVASRAERARQLRNFALLHSLVVWTLIFVLGYRHFTAVPPLGSYELWVTCICNVLLIFGSCIAVTNLIIAGADVLFSSNSKKEKMGAYSKGALFQLSSVSLNVILQISLTILMVVNF